MRKQWSETSFQKVRAQAIKYALIGLTANLLGFLAYLLLAFIIEPLAALAIVYLVVAVSTFFANRRLTFSYRGGLTKAGFRYMLALFLGFVIQGALFVSFYRLVGLDHLISQLAAMIAVAVILFFMSRYFVFRE